MQRRIANLTEAPKECSSGGEAVLPVSRDSLRSSSDLSEGMVMQNMGPSFVGGLEDGNIPTFLMDQLGPSPPEIDAAAARYAKNGLNGDSAQKPQMPQPQVKMNFTITSDDIVEMKIEPDVILAGDAVPGKKKRAFPESDLKMKSIEAAAAELAKQHVPPKKRRHDLSPEGGYSGCGSPNKDIIKEEPADETDLEGHLTIPVPPIMQQSARIPNLQRSSSSSSSTSTTGSRLDMLLSKGGHVAAADLSKLSRYASSSDRSGSGLGGRPVLLKPRQELGPNER